MHVKFSQLNTKIIITYEYKKQILTNQMKFYCFNISTILIFHINISFDLIKVIKVVKVVFSWRSVSVLMYIITMENLIVNISLTYLSPYEEMIDATNFIYIFAFNKNKKKGLCMSILRFYTSFIKFYKQQQLLCY